MDFLTKIKELYNNKNISDYHLRSGGNFAYRELGEVLTIPDIKITEKNILSFLESNCKKEEVDHFKNTNELDCAIVIDDKRFRANFYNTFKGPALVMRKIETEIPKMDNLNLPPILFSLLDEHKGLVLVTGPTGSGKSTTLAAIINEINENRKANIITVEDPIEYVHLDKQSIISQREVGKQTKNFASALKAALREDPDVILVGELRDLETVSLALTAAETGHLVFGTLHTSGAPDTINRIIDVFPSDQQPQIRAQIAQSLKMVVTQKLFKKKDGKGRVGAFEVMTANAPVKNLIRENKIHQITSVMQTAQREGMITMEKSIEGLVATGEIDNPGSE